MEMRRNQVEKLFHKLKMTMVIYKKSSDCIHNEPMTLGLNELAIQKKEHIEVLGDIIKAYDPMPDLNIDEVLKLELQKIGMSIDAFFIRRNEKEVLGFCLQYERSLKKIYQDLLAEYHQHHHFRIWLKDRLVENEELINKLEYWRDAYVFEYEET
jgi:hypothetical protein